MSATATIVQHAFQTVQNAKRVSADDLLILSGEMLAADVETFVDVLDLGRFEHAIVERVSRFDVVTANQFVVDEPTLERVRLFGSLGDLDLRRDGACFYWRFVGQPSDSWGFSAEATYWQQNPSPLLAIPKCYYQWRPEGSENNNRVTTHWRPTNVSQNYYLNQIHYLDNGRTAFVRFTGFSEVCDE